MSGQKSPIEILAEPVTELAKAEQEQQKSIQAAIGLTAAAGNFLSRVFGPAADEFGLALGEQTRFWRFSRLNKMLLKVQKTADDRGIHPDAIKALPFGMALRVVEAASNEEEDNVQDLWARLTTNAMDPEAGVTISKVHIDILKSVSSAEASLLDLIWESETHPDFHRSMTVREFEVFSATMGKVANQGWRRSSSDDRQVAVQNLVRLRCITFRPEQVNIQRLLTAIDRSSRLCAIDPLEFQRLLKRIFAMISISAGHDDPKSGQSSFPEHSFVLTPLGRGLMRACRRTRLFNEHDSDDGNW